METVSTNTISERTLNPLRLPANRNYSEEDNQTPNLLKHQTRDEQAVKELLAPDIYGNEVAEPFVHAEQDEFTDQPARNAEKKPKKSWAD